MCQGGLDFHGAGRNDTEMCVVCHNPNRPDVDMPYMIHKIHAAQDIPNVHDFGEVTYPQAINNCAKCHNGDDPETPDGNNWNTRPNKVACGSCHNVVFEEPVPEGMAMHTAGPQADNAMCATCHPPMNGLAPIIPAHLTENATPNNPGLPAGFADISYAINEVRVVDGNAVEIDFSILRDGVALDLLNLPADLTEPGRYPAFLMAYAMAPEGADTPADFNNLGNTAGQPTSVDIGGLLTDGNIAAAADAGVFTATIADGFPVGAQMRAVALQGYFQQVIDGENVARHAVSVYAGVTGDDQRREIVDPAKCGDCHEWFEGHGGNRVYETMVCVTCHNPNLSSSGRTAAADSLPQATIDALGMDPLAFPEDSNNFKELIHGIHGNEARFAAFEFVRNFRNSGNYYNFDEVTFPGDPSDCLTCHYEGTYLAEAIPANALLTTVVTTPGGEPDADGINAARASVPNATDLVHSPTAGACGACHNGDAAKAHFEQNGGIWARERGVADGQ